ncbi:MAG: hypothetical protein RLZZ347_707 [Candidatus Parcubacteria bacterium]|jgi:hypothetical protein
MDTTISKPKTSPKDFFLHLGAVITLYVSVISLINLLFEVINTAFPDALETYVDPYSYTMRLSVASLIILYPLYLFLMRTIRVDVEAHPEKREVGVRKWLTYLTLFVAGMAVVIDLITLINTFLGGEISTRFVLKILTVLIVAGIVFGYYLYDLKVSNTANQKIIAGFRWGTLALVLVSIVGAFVLIGSPMKQRDLRFDERRVTDLQNVQWQIINYWQQKGVMPKTLSALEDPISGYKVPVDPQTNQSYEYTLGGQNNGFKLCATFATDSAVSSAKSVAYYPAQSENWTHGVGKMCFDRTIDADLYPVRPTKGM